jgi:hypothetical protein
LSSFSLPPTLLLSNDLLVVDPQAYDNDNAFMSAILSHALDTANQTLDHVLEEDSVIEIDNDDDNDDNEDLSD